MTQTAPQVSVDYARNCEILERIYIGRRFRNYSKRLEKPFDIYPKMTARQGER